MGDVADVTVGIDIGTTAVKALAADDEGRTVASVRVPHDLVVGPGRLEHDAAAAWHRGVGAAFAEVAVGRTVRAVSVAAMVPSLTAVDAAGRPLGPGLLYGDARGEGVPGENPVTSGEALGFLRWLAKSVPDATGFWPAQAVANHALCGRAAIDFATAFCAGTLFDGSSWAWAPDLLASVGAHVEQMPHVAKDLGPIGEIGSAGGTLVGSGTVDAWAAQLVAGADEPGDVLVVLGATLIAWLVAPGWVERPGLWTMPGNVAGTCMVGGASNAGGLFVDWAGQLFPGSGSGSGSGRADLDPHDVPVWLPYPRGERTPLHRPDLRAELADLHIGHGPAAVQRATYEASGFVLRRFLDLAVADAAGGAHEPSSPPKLRAGSQERGQVGGGGGEVVAPRRLVAVGGGVRAAGWVEALADCTGLPVAVGAEPDASALGTAFLARCTAGLETDPAEARRWARTAATVEPDPAWTVAGDERYQRFLARTAAATGAAP